MKKRVHPQKSNGQSQISSTSRHELKGLREVEKVEPTEFNLSNLKLKIMVGQLAKKIKFLAPPSVKPAHVHEGWQQQLQHEEMRAELVNSVGFEKETLTEQISNRYKLFNVFSLCEGLLIIFFFWLVSVSLVFQEKMLMEVHTLVALISLVEMITKMKIAWDEHEQMSTYQIHWMHDFMEPGSLFLGAVLMLVRHFCDSTMLQYFIIPYEFTCIVLQWQKIGKYFSWVKLYAEQNKKRKQLRIIQLFGFTIVIAHVLALIMYAMIYVEPSGQPTWITKANLTGRPWYVLYIYAYYWANTTMVTVGYGDLTPSNHVEVLVVTIIQIVGTAVFGYMINVIGITVSEINKKNQQFQEYQATIFKLKNHYNLSRQLCYRMKNDIKKKQSEMKEQPLKNNEQSQFLQYVDGKLKDEFVLQTNMRVIKKSIFFLTHFTVNFQNQIALKLIRRIYKPDQPIHFQQHGQKQLVIIDSGKVNLYYKKNHLNQELLKLVRRIEPQEGKPTLNVYGYSSLILNKNINIKAITQDTSTAYILKRSDITQSMAKSMLDFESFNQLREKMQLCGQLQEVQAPALRQPEQHFLPNSYILLKKIRNQFQGRRKVKRSQRRSKRSLITIKHYQNKTMLYIPADPKSENQILDINSLLEIQNKQEKEQSHPSKSKYLAIDQAKHFQNFLKSFNLSVVAKDYERACLRKSYLNRVKNLTKSLKKYKGMGEPQFDGI